MVDTLEDSCLIGRHANRVCLVFSNAQAAVEDARLRGEQKRADDARAASANDKDGFSSLLGDDGGVSVCVSVCVCECVGCVCG